MSISNLDPMCSPVTRFQYLSYFVNGLTEKTAYSCRAGPGQMLLEA